jgi:hypothetical protein
MRRSQEQVPQLTVTISSNSYLSPILAYADALKFGKSDWGD